MKYIFATGGEDTFFNDTADMIIQQRQSQQTEQETAQETAAPEEENDFMKGLAEYDEETSKNEDIRALENVSKKLSELEFQLSEQAADYEKKLANVDFMASDDGQSFLNEMYDTGNENVPYTNDNNFITSSQKAAYGFLPQKANQSVGGTQVSKTHNNPLNIHSSAFASKYKGIVGAKDVGGNVAIFPTLETGIQAGKDLLFGDTYNNLTIAQARNRWVTGNPNKKSDSTDPIVREMGLPANTKLSNLTPAQKDKLFKQFAKWEGSEGYNTIKDIKLFQ
jgi:hypothetical protein